jgi:hypothetical protein
MPEPIDDFLGELNRRYPVDERFRRNIRPLVERIFDRSISSEERKRLLRLVEQTYRRQVENRENLERAKKGIRRIFSNLYKRILKDISPQLQGIDGPPMDPESTPHQQRSKPSDDQSSSFEEPPGSPVGDGAEEADDEMTGPSEPIWSESEDEAEPAEELEPISRRRDLLFGEFLIGRGALTRSALLGALEDQVREKPLLGWVGLRRGVLTEDQIHSVLTRQVREDRRFGEIAIDEGFLDAGRLDVLRRVQRKYTTPLGRILVARGDLSQDALDYYLEEFINESAGS